MSSQDPSSSRPRTLPSARGAFPIVLVMLGAALVTVSLAADLLGLGRQSGTFGYRQILAASLGAAALLAGIVGDLRIGDRLTARWWEEVALDRTSLLRFLLVSAQLGLVVLVIREYELGSPAFYDTILGVAFVGFLVQHFVPVAHRLRFFLALSLIGIVGVLGSTAGLWLIGTGLVLISIAHLPIGMWARVTLLLIVGTVLGLMRVDQISTPLPPEVLPILGAMFMFRLVIYLYDLEHGKVQKGVAGGLSYFFMLPNVVFPLFPVVDYTRFRQTHYNAEAHVIHQKGVSWMLRGLTHLLAYRFVNYYLAMAPTDVVTTGDLAQFLATNFLLYLRISGQFHLIIGMLALFGFNLPETNRYYVLSSSFTDFWRRINIYWKDFMQKIFFNPLYYRVRHLGPATAIVVSTIFVFVATWFLHAYQWFWIRGSFLVTTTDSLFWAALGLFMVGNSLYETLRPSRRTLGRPALTFRRAATRAFSTAAFFSTICILWALWTSETVSEWTTLMSVPGIRGAGAALGLGVAACLLIAGGAVAVESFRRQRTLEYTPTFLKSSLATGGALVLLFAVGHPLVYSSFEDETASVVQQLRMERLSGRDAAKLERGYYEGLVGGNQFSSQLWELYAKRPGNWELLSDTVAVLPRDDFLRFELRPSTMVTFRGAPLSVNRWGMRDQDYEKVAPASAFRMALLGSSHSMGSGVGDDENFESILEERLNRENTGEEVSRYEILNFAIDGYRPPQQFQIVDKALDFQPDVLLYVGHLRERDRSVYHLAERQQAGIEAPFPYLRDLLARAEVGPGMPQTEAERRLRPFADELTSWLYRGIVEAARERGVPAIWVFVPPPERTFDRQDAAALMAQAAEAGFTVLDLSDAYASRPAESLWVVEWDHHPNAAGHLLVAEALHTALQGVAAVPLPGAGMPAERAALGQSR